MSLILFAANLLETATVTVTSAAAGKPVTRLYDRDRGPQWEATSNAQQDIDLDNATAKDATHVAFVNYSITTQVDFYHGAAFPPATLLDTWTLSGDPDLRALTSAVLSRYMRIRIRNGGVTPKLGELFIGVPRTITLNPYYRQSGKGTVGNVQRDRSRAGHLWAVQRGVKRIRLPYGWLTLSDANLTTLEAAYDELNQGAKNLVVQDPNATSRWMSWLDERLAPVPVGGGLNEIAIELEEAP